MARYEYKKRNYQVVVDGVNGEVLYGNNEDYHIPTTYYWTRPSGDGRYGGWYVGFDDRFAQGGVNEKGLAFDYNALPEVPLTQFERFL